MHRPTHKKEFLRMRVGRFLFIAGSLFLISPVLVFAQTSTYVPLEPLPGLGAGATYTFPAIMSAFFTIFLLLGAALAVLMFTFGGIQYMTSDVLGQKEAGRQRLKNSALGFFLLLAIYIILKTINPQLTNFNLDFGLIGSKATTPVDTQSGPANYLTPTAGGLQVGAGATGAQDPTGYNLTVVKAINNGVPVFQQYFFSNNSGGTASAQCDAFAQTSQGISQAGTTQRLTGVLPTCQSNSSI